MTPEQALIVVYAQAAKRLRVQIRAALSNGAVGTAAYRAEQLKIVQRQLQQLGKSTKPLILPVVFEPYVRGGQIVDVGLGRTAAGFAFTGPHPLAAQALAENLSLRLGRARDTIGRRVDDVFRRVGLEEVATGVVSGSARREVSAALQARLIREGVTDSLTGFVDARGARWQLDVYSEMVARTTTREAMSAGTRNRMAELALDLVTISSHADPCDLCASYDGNTYSINGSTDGYDVLDQWPPFHPNCIHVATPASANLDAIEAELGLAVA